MGSGDVRLRSRPRRVAVGARPALAALALAACVPPGDPSDAPPAADAQPAADGGAGGAVVIDPPARTPPCADDEYYVGRVVGLVRDYGDRPVPGAPVSICGTACIPGETGADGRFDVTVNLCFAGSSEYAHGAAFAFDGANQRPDVYFDFNPGDQTRMGVVRLVRPIYVASYQGAGYMSVPVRPSAARVLVDGLGFSLRVVPGTIQYPLSATEEVVRAVRVSVARLPPYPGPAPAVMYAISPSDATLAEPVAVEFPNVSGLPPGAAVDIVAVGNHASQGRAPVGVLARVDAGRVSEDGRRVVAATGLRFFGTVGYRAVSR